MRRLGLVLLLAACETPPSKYIPPPEPREVPNVDPPPGIPIMPSASPSAKTAPGSSAAPITPNACKTNADCVEPAGSDYIARCSNKTCTRVEKKKPKKK